MNLWPFRWAKQERPPLVVFGIGFFAITTASHPGCSTMIFPPSVLNGVRLRPAVIVRRHFELRRRIKDCNRPARNHIENSALQLIEVCRRRARRDNRMVIALTFLRC